MKKLAVVLIALCCALAPAAFASPVLTGSITFTGSEVTLANSNGQVNTVDTATKITNWGTVTVGLSDLSGPTANSGDVVTFAAPWSFNTTTPIANFWQVDGYTFELTSSSIFSQGDGGLTVSGVGILSANGYADTPGMWHFSTNNPGVGRRNKVFSFSAGTDMPQTPELSSIALFGSGLLTFAGFARRRFLK